MELIQRPRRLRKTEALRGMVRETRVSVDSLVYPIFVKEGRAVKEEIPSMPGQYRYSVERLSEAIEQIERAGVKHIMLFGIPEKKDETGTGAWADDGIVQQAIREIKTHSPKLSVITDVCLCEYTSHGHCGVLVKDSAQNYTVDNDRTLELLAQTAYSHIQAGADMVAPSDMMDGRIRAIREKFDRYGCYEYPIMSYAVKYASSFYGPFREAAGSTPSCGDRKSYQMDYHNRQEALKEAELDVAEGADILMVKPGLPCLDIVREVADRFLLPTAVYSVSGEYAMIKAAAEKGYIDENGLLCESAVSMYRAGADILITYFAKELAGFIREGRIG